MMWASTVKGQMQGLVPGVYSSHTRDCWHTQHTGVSTRGAWGRTVLSRPWASWHAMGEEGGFSLLLSLGTEGTHEQTLPLLPLSQGQAIHGILISNHYSKWRRDWPGPNHYRVRCKR